ncbi:class I SAM-dependent methyltransferase [Rhodococcus sp. NPDC078407]|uniref:class I SAM-dependent methyltransferase n=1 Tax=Rhodococcus sp. NPDC078407 TaxID=3364509 RepID=UPI0037C6095F
MSAVHYSDRLAAVYDRMYPDAYGELDSLCAFVVGRLPANGRVLEYGVGTGRVALPLAERGVEVTGIDVSEEMLAVLKKKDPDGRISCASVDFIDDRVAGTYNAVLLVINTFFVAQSLDQQVRIFENAAANLEADGFFVLETLNPASYHALSEPKTDVRHLAEDAVMIDHYIVDQAQQILLSRHTLLDGGAPETTTHVVRYAFPAEIDAVARIAGFELVERFSSWRGSPYVHGSPRSIAVYKVGNR